MAIDNEISTPTSPIPRQGSQVASGASGLDATPDGGTLESGLVSGEDVAASSLTRGSSRNLEVNKGKQTNGMNLPQVDVEFENSKNAKPVITFKHLTKIYEAQPTKPALKDIDLQIYAGEFVFLVGHSGSGKSTFIRLITRELRPTKGRLLIADEDLGSMRN